jgi:hypothetical protein
MEEEKIQIVIFNVEELFNSLEKLKTKCIEPIMDNNTDLEENRELFTYYLYIKESFKTLRQLQELIKTA